MSMSVELSNPYSPLSRILRENLPYLSLVAREKSKALRGYPTETVAGSTEHRWLGTAIDYRLRHWFPWQPSHVFDTIAPLGARVAMGGCSLFPVYYAYSRNRLAVSEPILARIESEARFRKPPPESCLAGRVIADFYVAFGEAMQSLKPSGRLLPLKDEALLCRFFAVMARLDWFFRVGFEANRPSPLIFPKPKRSVEDLLAVSPDAMIVDMVRLSRGFYETQQELLSKPHVLNPKFVSGRRVGGADADLIVDRCLIDFKTTIQPQVARAHFRQLIGYALLDSFDEYRLEEVGLYFTRQRCLLKWGIDRLLHEFSGGSAPKLATLRKQVLDAYKTNIPRIPPEERLA